MENITSNAGAFTQPTGACHSPFCKVWLPFMMGLPLYADAELPLLTLMLAQVTTESTQCK
jgi:hypothetical protein